VSIIVRYRIPPRIGQCRDYSAPGNMDRGLRRRLPKLACIPSGGRGREWAVDRWCAARGVTRGECALLVGLAVRSAMPGGVLVMVMLSSGGEGAWRYQVGVSLGLWILVCKVQNIGKILRVQRTECGTSWGGRGLMSWLRRCYVWADGGVVLGGFNCRRSRWGVGVEGEDNKNWVII